MTSKILTGVQLKGSPKLPQLKPSRQKDFVDKRKVSIAIFFFRFRHFPYGACMACMSSRALCNYLFHSDVCTIKDNFNEIVGERGFILYIYHIPITIFTAKSAEINYTERKFFRICDCNYLVSYHAVTTARKVLLKFLKFQ